MLQNQVRCGHPGSTAPHEQALRPAFPQTSISIAPMTGPAPFSEDGHDLVWQGRN